MSDSGLMETIKPGISGRAWSHVPDNLPSRRQVLSSRARYWALFSAFATLTLGVMGSSDPNADPDAQSILPLSNAFATTGITAAFVLLAVVMSANNWTAHMLIWQSYKVGTVDYESLGYAIGGPFWKFCTEASIVLLMVGTLIGGIAQVGECFSFGLELVCTPPSFFSAGFGRWIMLLLVLVVVFPLCFPKNLTALDKAGVVGFCIVVFMTIWIMIISIKNGLPAVPNKGLSNVGFNVGIGNIGSAMSIFGFVFFIQPIMMAMMQEMPDGVYGVKILGYGMSACIFGSGFITYSLIGFFGAANYGADTASNILENTWGNKWVQLFINLSIAIYLALSLPPVVYPTRMAMNQWLPGDRTKKKIYRKVLLLIIIIGFSLAIAMSWPSQSTTFLTITGATGVLLTSYLLPVINHYLLYFGLARCQRAEGLYRMPTHPFWHRNGSDEANATWVPGRDGVQPLETEVRSNRSTAVKNRVARMSMSDGVDPPEHGAHLEKESIFVGPATARQHIIGDTEETDEKLNKGGEEVDPEIMFRPGEIRYRPYDKMWYRHKYKYYAVEVLLELVLPIAIVGVGGFASGTALKTVNFNCLNGC